MSFAVGIMQMSLFCGITAGPPVGGLLSEATGFRGAFFGASAIFAVGTAATFFWARGEPSSAEATSRTSLRNYFSDFLHRLTTGPLPKVLAVLAVIYIAPMMTYPVLPVLLRANDQRRLSTASMTGFLFGAMGLASAVGSLAVARYGLIIGLSPLIVDATFVVRSISVSMLFARKVSQVFMIVTVVGVCSGAMMASGSAAVALLTPATQQGRTFGAV